MQKHHFYFDKFTLMIFFGFFILNCSYLQAADKKDHFTPPVMGWASWNNFRIHINEDIIKSQADAMVKLGLNKYGYQFINIDDGFFGGRDSDGRLMYHPKRFPNGMKKLANYIHSKKLKAGIYSDAGINTCGSGYDKDTVSVGLGLFGHEEQDLNLFLNEWDFDFLKVDWCGGIWLGLDEESRYSEIGRIAKKIKPSVIYNVCRWEFPGKWVTQVADSWRISGDIDNHFGSILRIIDLNADLWMYSSRGHYNDMDMLQVGRGMTYEEDKAHFSMWCIMQSPLLLGNDLTKISDQTLEIITNKDLIEVNQSPFVYQARRIIDEGDLEVWGKPMVSTMSGDVVVALLNRSNLARDITFNPDKAGIQTSKGYSIKDLWSKETTSKSTAGEIVRTVPAHGVVVLRLKGTAIPYNFFQFKENKKQ